VGDVSGWERIELGDGELRAVVLPGRGGDVLSLRHAPSGAELLWQAPWDGHRGPAVPAGADFHDWYLGGWQDLFPNGGAPGVVDGVAHEQHGESWRRAWAVERDGGALELSVALETLPLRARKRIEVAGATLRISEQVANAGGAAVRMMWGHHPAFGGDLVERGCRVDLPGGRTECFGGEVDTSARLASHGEGRWPSIPGRDGRAVDLSVVPGPESRSHDVCLIGELEAGWYAVRNPARGLGVALRFPRELFRWLWMWQPFGGASAEPFSRGTYALALEPWTSPPSLEAAVRRGEEVLLAAGERLEAELELTVFAADERPVLDVGPGGAIVFG
jgi:galactose mutarotase-like enzyme